MTNAAMLCWRSIFEDAMRASEMQRPDPTIDASSIEVFERRMASLADRRFLRPMSVHRPRQVRL
jgi:hypothetical protein